MAGDERVEYTPTTDEVRAIFGGFGREFTMARNLASFDRWLAAHDAEAIAGQRGGVGRIADLILAVAIRGGREGELVGSEDREDVEYADCVRAAERIAALRPSVSGEQVEDRLNACERALGSARDALVCTACKGSGEGDDEGEREACQACGGSGDRTDEVRREARTLSLSDVRHATGTANTSPNLAARRGVSDEWVDEFLASLGMKVRDAD